MFKNIPFWAPRWFRKVDPMGIDIVAAKDSTVGAPLRLLSARQDEASDPRPIFCKYSDVKINIGHLFRRIRPRLNRK